MDVARAHHRCRLFTPPSPRIQTTFDSALAITQDFRVTSTHSKCLSSLAWLALSLPSKPSIEAHFELFCPPHARLNHASLRASARQRGVCGKNANTQS